MTTKHANDPQRGPHSRPAWRVWASRGTRTTLLILAAGTLASALAASAALREREPAARERPGARSQLLTVSVTTLDRSEHFARTHSFLGRVEPARSSAIGFELAGKLRRIEVDEGALVRRGDALAWLDTARLDATGRELDAAVTVAIAELDLARSTRQRIIDLSGKGHASQQRRDESDERFRAAQASLALARARLASLRTELSKSVLHAPFDARIVARHVDEGRVIGTGAAVFTLHEERHPQARIGLPANLADRIDRSTIYTLIIGGSEYRARPRAVLPVTGSRTRTVDVLLDIEVQAGELRAGDLAQMLLPDSIAAAGAWVPLSALTAGRRGTWVLYGLVPADTNTRVAASGNASQVVAMTVEVLTQNDTRAYVRGAFADGDRVIAHGLNRVVPGQRVRIDNEGEQQ